MTEKKPSREAKLASRTGEQVFLLLFQNHPLPMWIYDLETLAFLDVNDAAVTKYGYSRAEFMEMAIEDIHASEDVPHLLVDTAERRSAVLHSRECRHRRRDGRVIDVEITSHTLEFDGRKAVLAIVQDITEQKRAELERKRAEEQALVANERLQYLLSSTSAVIYTAKTSGNYGATFISRNVSQMVGYDPREFTEDSRFWFNHVHPDDQALISDAVSETFQKEFHAYEYRFRCRDGEYIWVRDEMRLVRDGDGNPLEIIGFWVDITEHKKAEEALRQSEQRWKDLFRRSRNAIAVYAAINDGRDFIFKDFNPAAEHIEGVKREDIVDRRVTEVFPGVESFGLLDVFRRVWKTGNPEHHDVSLYKDEKIEGWRENFVYRLQSGEIVAIYDDVTERKQAEEELRKARQDWEDIFQAIGHPTMLLSPNQTIMVANRAALRATSMKPTELLGRKCHEIFHPTNGNQPPECCPVRKMFQSGQVQTEEMKVEALGGCFLVSCTPVFDDKGNLRRVIHIATDITERKRAEEALFESETKYRTLITQSPDGIFIVDLSGNFLSVNKAMCDNLKYTEEEFLSMEIWDIVPQQYLLLHKDRLAAITKGRTNEAVEYEVKGKDGIVHYVEVLSAPHYKEKEIIGFQGIARDMTERKRAEEALRQSEERFRGLFVNSPISLWEEDFSEVRRHIDRLRTSGVEDFRTYFQKHPEEVANCAAKVRVVDVNQATLQLYQAGDKAELLAGLGLVFGTESYEVFAEELIALAEGKIVFEGEAITQTLTGNKNHIILKWLVAPGYKETSSKVFVSIIDITERKLAEEKIFKANRVYAVISQINQAIVRMRERDKLFEETCRIAVEHGKFQMAWIGLVDEKTKLVNPLVYCGVEDGYLTRMKRISIGDVPEGRGPTGMAIREGRHFVCSDIENDPRMAPWREEALKRGYRSSIALPIKLFGKVVGAFSLYAAIPHFFDQEEINLLDEVAADISFALEAIETEKRRKEAEQALQKERDFLKRINDTSPVGITLVDLNGRITFANNRAEAILGLTKEEIAERTYNAPEWKITDLRGDPFLKDNLPFNVVAETRRPVFDVRHAIEWKDGKRIPLSINASPMFSDQGEFDGMVTSIEDISEKVRAEEDRKRLTRRLVEVQETERRAIARELHDEIGQELTALKIGLQDAASSFPENKLRPHIEDSLKSVERTLERVRNLSLELRPSMLDDLGLLPTLRWLLDRTAQRSGVKCTMQAEIRGEKIAPEIAVTCYRVVQQALTNVGRHAKAKSVEVSIRREDHRLSVQIADDGIGFDVRGARKRALLGESLGLLSMEERVGLLGGKFEIRSSKGKGTVVRAEFPM